MRKRKQVRNIIKRNFKYMLDDDKTLLNRVYPTSIDVVNKILSLYILKENNEKEEYIITSFDDINNSNAKLKDTGYVLDFYLKLDEDNTEILFPFDTNEKYNYNFIIDYGDNTKEKLIKVTENNRKHIYKTKGTYNVKIEGLIECFDVYNFDSIMSKIYGTFGGTCEGLKKFNIACCENVTHLSETFFSRNTSIYNASGMFEDCTGLIDLPEKLFNHCLYFTDVSSMFSNCSKLVSIPDDCLGFCMSISNASNMFSMCTSLKNIPETFLSECLRLENVSSFFYGCRSLEGIPRNFLKNNTEITNISNLISGCVKITYLPVSLLENNIKLTNVNSAFRDCSNITSLVPELWDEEKYKNVTDFGSTFKNCNSVSNFDDIPLGWK